MRKSFLFALMMTLLLLPGCSRADKNPLRLALELRARQSLLPDWETHVHLTADYGQRVYDFEMDVTAGEEELLMTLTAPETLAGITARLEGEQGFLDYDGLQVETGPLDGEELSPMTALPALLEAARRGYITGASLQEEGLLRVDIGSREEAPGTGQEFVLWLDPDSGALVRGEISLDGARCILCTFTPLL